jgi:hypothetical protein
VDQATKGNPRMNNIAAIMEKRFAPSGVPVFFLLSVGKAASQNINSV